MVIVLLVYSLPSVMLAVLEKSIVWSVLAWKTLDTNSPSRGDVKSGRLVVQLVSECHSMCGLKARSFCKFSLRRLKWKKIPPSIFFIKYYIWLGCIWLRAAISRSLLTAEKNSSDPTSPDLYTSLLVLSWK